MGIGDFWKWLSVGATLLGFFGWGVKQWTQVSRNKKDIEKVDGDCKEIGKRTTELMADIRIELAGLKGEFKQLNSWVHKLANSEKRR